MQSTEDDQRRRDEGGRRMKKKGAAAGALARVRGVMGTLPSFSMSTTRRRGHGHGHGYDGPGPGPDPPRPGEELLQLELALQGQGREQQQEEKKHEEEEENRPRGPWTSVKTAVDRHELISFLDDADADDFSPSRFLAAPTTAADDTNTTTTTTTTATSSIFIIDRDEDEDETEHAEDDRDRDDGLAHTTANTHNITNTNNKKNIDANTATTTTAVHILLARESSFYSSARSSFESTNLTALSAATTAATTTITTTTMAPLTALDAKDGGRTTAAAPAGTTTTTRTSADSGSGSAFVDDWSRDLWDYLHHGLDGQSSPDLRLLLENDYPSLLSSPSEQEQEQEQEHDDGDADGSMHRLHQRDVGYHRHLHQQQQQQEQEQQQRFEPPSSSSTYHQVLNDIRPESSRSFQNRLNNTALCRNNSQHHYSHFRGASTESAGAATATWTLRSGRSHEKSNSGSSKTTTATAMTIPTIISSGGGGARESKATALTGMTASTMATTTSTTTTASTNTTKTTTLSAPSSTMLAAGGLPPVSPSTASFGAEMTKQEFEALPEAIQRKYFSSLERLHFASLAPAPPATPDYINSFFDRPETSPNPQTLKQRRRARQAKLASDNPAERFKRRNSRRSRVTSTSSSVYVRLPDKIKRRHLTTEEQLVSSTNRRHDIILDPADEAIYKVRRRASSLVIPDELWSPTLSVRPQTMESQPSQKQPPKTSPAPQEKKSKSPPKAPQRSMPASPQKKRDSFYDSFRWLEDDDLDLRLHLDDYHANLREDLPTPSKQRRPSFRRHLSISKIPFGRTSLSMNRPGTTQAVVTSHPSSPLFGNAPSSPHASSPGHGRRRSRALSLITPKHSPQDALGVFDPEAAHYQDPEARLKLRVYLASPQKFDEAIEFGFPSKEAMTPQAVRELKDSKTRRTKALPSDESDNLRTFLADDRSSIYSEDGSLDSDSPKTPQTVENATALRPPPVKSDRAYSPKPSHEYAPAETREMTLRMTLTRPDLRAHEDQIYGWQQKCCPPGRKSQSNALRDELPAALARDGSSKESIERQLAAMDQWNAQTSDRGVMKRFWNKVRRGPT